MRLWLRKATRKICQRIEPAIRAQHGYGWVSAGEIISAMGCYPRYTYQSLRRLHKQGHLRRRGFEKSYLYYPTPEYIRLLNVAISRKPPEEPDEREHTRHITHVSDESERIAELKDMVDALKKSPLPGSDLLIAEAQRRLERLGAANA